MTQNLRDGFIVAASTEGEDLWVEMDPAEYQMGSGLLKAHAYNVLEARTTQAGLNLYKLRNIWKSQLAWQGTFSKGSNHWTESLAHELGHDLNADDHDYIWMTEEELRTNFSSVSVCKIAPDDETLRLKGEFVKGFKRSTARFEDKSVRSRYQYEIQLEQKQRLSVIIHQNDIRI